MKIAYDPKTDSFLKEQLAAANKELFDARERLRRATKDVNTIMEKRQAWDEAVMHYQLDTGVVVIDHRYTPLYPAQQVDLWADEHDNVIVMKEIAKLLKASGVYNAAWQAHQRLYNVVGQNSRFHKLRPGVYQRLRKPKETRPTLRPKRRRSRHSCPTQVISSARETFDWAHDEQDQV